MRNVVLISTLAALALLGCAQLTRETPPRHDLTSQPTVPLRIHIAAPFGAEGGPLRLWTESSGLWSEGRSIECVAGEVVTFVPSNTTTVFLRADWPELRPENQYGHLANGSWTASFQLAPGVGIAGALAGWEPRPRGTLARFVRLPEHSRAEIDAEAVLESIWTLVAPDGTFAVPVPDAEVSHLVLEVFRRGSTALIDLRTFDPRGTYTLPLGGAQEIAGTVKLPDGSAFSEGWTVRCEARTWQPPGLSNAVARIDEDGNFRLANLATGQFDVSVEEAVGISGSRLIATTGDQVELVLNAHVIDCSAVDSAGEVARLLRAECTTWSAESSWQAWVVQPEGETSDVRVVLPADGRSRVVLVADGGTGHQLEIGRNAPGGHSAVRLRPSFTFASLAVSVSSPVPEGRRMQFLLLAKGGGTLWQSEAAPDTMGEVRANFDGLAPGEYELMSKAVPPGELAAPTAPTIVRVASGETAWTTVDLVASGLAHVAVTDSSGSPVARIGVTRETQSELMSDMWWGVESEPVDPVAGVHRILGLPRGQHRLLVRANGELATVDIAVTATPSTTTVQLAP